MAMITNSAKRITLKTVSVVLTGHMMHSSMELRPSCALLPKAEHEIGGIPSQSAPPALKGLQRLSTEVGTVPERRMKLSTSPRRPSSRPSCAGIVPLTAVAWMSR
eukprot:4175369-Prymnesium_polylepis.1